MQHNWSTNKSQFLSLLHSLWSDHKENMAALLLHCIATLFTIGLYRINSFPIVAGTDRIENNSSFYCCRFEATTLKRTTKKTCHVVFTVSSLQTLQFQYIILIPYILDDYNYFKIQCRISLQILMLMVLVPLPPHRIAYPPCCYYWL
jgi:hypothetical protein